MDFVIAASAVAVAIGGWTKLIRPLYHAVRSIYANGQAAFALLDAQLTANGGGSLLDQMKAHGVELTKQGEEQVRQGERLKVQCASLRDIRDRLENLEAPK